MGSGPDVAAFYSTFIHKTRYARWKDDLNRREHGEETVHRYMDFFGPRIPEKDRHKISNEIEQAILDMGVMPSMRAMMTAGKALEKDNAAGYNCAYLAVDDQRAFDEAMYLSMCGTGVGFSVERQYVNQLPTVAESFHDSSVVLKVRDSKIGWATAFKELIALLYTGMIPTWDLSAIRQKGAKLKTFGGRASGPEPLNDLMKFSVRLFQGAAGRKLTSIECHDLMCKVADVVVSGGVRRSAMISLSNLSDERMRHAKTGEWYKEENTPWRRLANNSAVYTEKPEIGMFMKEWLSLYESKSGERGIFNRASAVLAAKATGRRKWEGIEFGCNPCGEILLRSMSFCNLTEVVIRPTDTWADIRRKVRLATILGTLQATLTDFRYLRKQWKKNAEEERLLGVSLTGIEDNRLTSTNGPDLEKNLAALKQICIEVNTEWSDKLGINPAAAVTCIKPSGTVSQLVDCAPGIHDRHSRFVLRATRNDAKDPVTEFLKAMGVPWEPESSKPNDVCVFYFPMKSPDTSVFRTDRNAIQQLELYLTYKRHWTEHNPSCTIYIREHEWLAAGAWVYENFNEIGGISFLPYSEHIYKQAPNTEITKAEYDKLVAAFPVVDWNLLPEFEIEDCTNTQKEPACAGGSCEI